MKYSIAIAIFAALLAGVLAAPLDDSRDAQTTKLESAVGPEEYSFKVETSDGKSHEEQGHLDNPGTDNEAIVVRGSYSYTAPDGQVYTVNYIADVNGFQPEGAHLPNVPSN